VQLGRERSRNQQLIIYSAYEHIAAETRQENETPMGLSLLGALALAMVLYRVIWF
jgi:hypothetical protein